MFKFFKLLKGKLPPSPEIQVAIDRTREAHQAARDHRASLEAPLKDALLQGDAAAAREIRAKISDLDIEIESHQEGLGALEDKLAAARTAEAKASLDATLAEAERASAVGQRAIKRYGELAAEIADALLTLEASDQIVGAANEAAKTAGDKRRVQTANEVLRCVPDKVEPARTKLVHPRIPSKEQMEDGPGGRPSGMKPNTVLAPTPREVQVPEKVIPGYRLTPLNEAVVLPGITTSLESIWPRKNLFPRQGWRPNFSSVPDPETRKSETDLMAARVAQVRKEAAT